MPVSIVFILLGLFFFFSFLAMEKISYLVVSDIHLGHPNTPTDHIVHNLKKELFAHKELDYLFIAGDMFHRLLDFNNEDVYSIVSFIYDLTQFCYSTQTKLRILEGTPSHDWQQSKIFVEINQAQKYPCNLKYFTSLDIEIDDDLTILYVPDEWAPDEQTLEDEINLKLSQYHLKEVDIAIMHGAFSYQDPENYVKNKFRESYFMSIVKHFIHVGHFHSHSYYMNKIIAQGSFDRLAHGEEEDKGYVIATIYKDDLEKDSWSFISNKNSYVYKTLDLSSRETIESLRKKIAKYPKGSYIRLRMKADHPLNEIYDQIKVLFLDYNIRRKIESSNSTDKKELTYIEDESEFVFETITLENITQRLRKQIEMKSYNFSENDWSLYDKTMQEFCSKEKQ